MVVLFGLPDMGRVCAEKHAPTFKSKVRLSSLLRISGTSGDEEVCVNGQADELKQKGIDKVYCLAVSEPGKLEEWGRQQGFASSNVRKYIY